MKIIVALDGSPSSEPAFEALKKLKWPGGTEIKLLAVVSKSDDASGFAGKRSASATEHDREIVEGATETLESMAQKLRTQLPQCIITDEVRQGDAKSKIVEQAEDWTAELIVMGSRGIKGIQSMLLGSVSQSVVAQSPCPVIVARSGGEQASGFKNVLLTVDNSPYSRAMLDWVKCIDWGTGTKFTLITIVPNLIDSVEVAVSGAGAEGLVVRHQMTMNSASEELERLAQELAEHIGDNGRVSSQVGEGDPREVILSTASGLSADLIVMGSHGRTGLNKLFMGSVSQAVAMHAPSSVAIVRGLIPSGQAKPQQTGMFSIVPGKERLD